MDFQGLLNSVTSILNRRKYTQDQLIDWVNDGIQRVQRECRLPPMEKIVQVTISDSYQPLQGLVIPSDYLELIDILNPQYERVKKGDITEVMQMAKTHGHITLYYRFGGSWILGNSPTPGQTITLVYYSQLDPLVNPTDTTPLLQIAPRLFVYSALTFAAPFFTDMRAGDFEQRYQQIKGELEKQGDDDELSGGTGMSPGWYYPDSYNLY